MSDIPVDENFSVFVSDIHVKPDSYQTPCFEKAVEKILALNPRPKRVVCFGDVAWVLGQRCDYETSRPLWNRLLDAGIEITLGMGNHDHRSNFWALWPEYEERTLVPGRVVTKTDLGSCDLLLLDSFWEDHTDETRMTMVDGQLNGEQWEWLKAELPKWPRPVIVGAHHAIINISDGDKTAINDLIMSSPNVVGYIHGHDHVWKNGVLRPSVHTWSDNTFKRWLCLPSTGHWGDIGFVKFYTGPNFARAELVEYDHYFPSPDKRCTLDDDVIEENQGRFMTFRW